MIRIILVLSIVVMMASPTMATRIVSDNSTESPQTCEFDAFPIPCVLNAHGGVNTNIDAIASGSYGVRARYCVQGGLWCSEWSDPLSFTKPALNRPANLKPSK